MLPERSLLWQSAAAAWRRFSIWRRTTVLAEVTVGGGPSSVAINGNLAAVVNQETDNVSVIDLTPKRSQAP